MTLNGRWIMMSNANPSLSSCCTRSDLSSVHFIQMWHWWGDKALCAWVSIALLLMINVSMLTITEFWQPKYLHMLTLLRGSSVPLLLFLILFHFPLNWYYYSFIIILFTVQWYNWLLLCMMKTPRRLWRRLYDRFCIVYWLCFSIIII